MQGCQWRNATDIINDFIGNNGGLGKNTAAVSDAVVIKATLSFKFRFSSSNAIAFNAPS